MKNTFKLPFYFGAATSHEIVIATKSPPEENMLINIEKAGYSGFVLSEAKTSLQTLSEFKTLNEFILKWQKQYVAAKLVS